MSKLTDILGRFVNYCPSNLTEFRVLKSEGGKKPTQNVMRLNSNWKYEKKSEKKIKIEHHYLSLVNQNDAVTAKPRISTTAKIKTTKTKRNTSYQQIPPQTKSFLNETFSR